MSTFLLYNLIDLINDTVCNFIELRTYYGNNEKLFEKICQKSIPVSYALIKNEFSGKLSLRLSSN